MTVIEEMTLADLLGVAVLERQCFTVPWSETLLKESLLSPLDSLWVLRENGILAGYCNFRVIAGEGELMRIAVSPAFRGRGLGRKLMERLEADARKRGVSDITLEVRISNEQAIALYKSCGFKTEAVRKRYYTVPVEDALIMWRREG